MLASILVFVESNLLLVNILHNDLTFVTGYSICSIDGTDESLSILSAMIDSLSSQYGFVLRAIFLHWP